MTNAKRLCAILIAAILIISTAAACNANATWIMKNDGKEIPVGIYICYLMEVQSDAQTKVKENIEAQTTTSDSKEESATQATTKAIDYEKEKIDGKTYADWIKDEALLKVKEHIVIKQKFEEYKLKLTDEQTQNIKSIWSSSATQQSTYGDFYESNGVSQKSFEEFVTVSYEKSELIKYYYSADGEEPIKDDVLIKELKENYATAYILAQSKVGVNSETSSYETYSDDIIKKMKDKMKDYITGLNKDEDYAKLEKSFKSDMAKILGNDTDDDKDGTSTSSASNDDKTEKLKPTPNIQLRSISDESDAVGAALKKAKVGVAGLAESESALTVYKKTDDLTENPYYLDAQKATLINDMKGDEFDKLIEKWAGELKVTVNKKATSAYTFKDLKSAQ